MAEKRKSLTKKERFEVFKRDSFTCQYCGAKAPDVILEVDHIIPVKEGGTNDIMNLITACFDCNRGKAHRKLSDNTIIEKRRKQAEETQERIEMIEMIAEWQKEIVKESEIQINTLEALFQSYYKNWRFSESYIRELKVMIKKFGYREVYSAMERSLDYYDDVDDALNKVGGICYNRQRDRGDA